MSERKRVRPVKKQSFSLSITTTATGERLYGLLADVSSWVDWAPLVSHAALIRHGASDPTGAGAVRRVGGLGVISVDEEVLEAEPGLRQRYTATKGLPVSMYDAEVRFVERPDGLTELVWRSSFVAKPSVIGPVLGFLLKAAIGRLARGLVAAAEK